MTCPALGVPAATGLFWIPMTVWLALLPDRSPNAVNPPPTPKLSAGTP
jgi:hypothetical protein